MEQSVMHSGGHDATDIGAETTHGRPVYRPVSDIYEKGEKIFVSLEMPGVAPDSIDVTLEKRVLTIRGSSPARPRDGFRQVHAEYVESDYERAFTISEDIDQEALSANYVNGVLTLELPKAATAQPRKIAVNTA